MLTQVTWLILWMKGRSVWLEILELPCSLSFKDSSQHVLGLMVFTSLAKSHWLILAARSSVLRRILGPSLYSVGMSGSISNVCCRCSRGGDSRNSNCTAVLLIPSLHAQQSYQRRWIKLKSSSSLLSEILVGISKCVSGNVESQQKSETSRIMPLPHL